MERTVKVAGEDTAVRTLKIKDQTAACKVSLWRDLSKIKTTVGQHIELTNVIVQVYQEEKSVSTTSRTKLVVSFISQYYSDFALKLIARFASSMNLC